MKELGRIIYEICSAMKYFHAHKIVHRNLKMTNILVSFQKHVKICGFDIARLVDTTTCTSMTHEAGHIIFMAPQLFIDINLDFHLVASKLLNIRCEEKFTKQ